MYLFLVNRNCRPTNKLLLWFLYDWYHKFCSEKSMLTIKSIIWWEEMGKISLILSGSKWLMFFLSKQSDFENNWTLSQFFVCVVVFKPVPSVNGSGDKRCRHWLVVRRVGVVGSFVEGKRSKNHVLWSFPCGIGLKLN